MSHFTVAVVTKDKNKIGEILAPYNENLEVPKYVEYTKEELINKGKKKIEEFKNGAYAEYLKNPTKYKKDCSNEQHIKYLEEEFPKKLNWNDEEIYAEQISWYEEEQIGENGEVYSTYNPNSKWDWYSIGGRWLNTLLVKEDVESINGDAGLGADYLIHKVAPVGYKWTNGAKIKDIDFDKMKEISKEYDKAIRFWELKVEEKEPINDKDKELLKWDLYTKEYYIKRYETKEHYATIQSTFHTFAMVDEKGWNEKGKMMCFGLDDTTKEREEIYIEKFKEVIEDPNNQDKYLIIVDCHI